jgi:hypothetical protein
LKKLQLDNARPKGPFLGDLGNGSGVDKFEDHVARRPRGRPLRSIKSSLITIRTFIGEFREDWIVFFFYL